MEAWMDDDDNFGGFSSSEDENIKDEIIDTKPEEKVKEEAAVEPCEEKNEPEKEAAIGLPMTGATEAWMDDDDNFGGFSSSKDEITYTIPATVEPETTVETKASEEKIEPEKEV